MESRRLGKSGLAASEVGFGAWAVGGSWGETDDGESLAAMHAAVDAGVTFFDTADVYGDGRSERLIGRLLRERDEPLVVATKFGRAAPLDLANLTYEKLRGWLEHSRENLDVADGRPRPVALPAVGRLLHAVGVRGVRPAGRRAARRRLRRERGEGRGGVEGDRVPGRLDGADHLQHLPSAARRAVLRTRHGGETSA